MSQIEPQSQDPIDYATPGDAPARPRASAMARAFRQPRFLAAAALLAVSAAGLNGATDFLKLHFRKEAVALPEPALSDASTGGIPSQLGPWVQATRDQPLDPEIEGSLGTKQYINRQYVDSRLWPAAATEFKGLSLGEREQKLVEIENAARRDPDHPTTPVLTIGVTYYTGLVDTVSHIPERCYVADGFEPSSHELFTVPHAGMSNGAKVDVPFRFISFEDQTGRGRVGRCVGYFFQVNGDYTDDPIVVREHLQQLLQRYGYYAKIEMMAETGDPSGSFGPAYKAAAEKAMKDFIVTGLPAIEKCLPDWTRVARHGR